MQDLTGDRVRAEVAEGQASFQMVLPMSLLLSEIAGAIEQIATKDRAVVTEIKARQLNRRRVFSSEADCLSC
ncbi:MAG TPA: hypothetical protein PKZ07_07005 [Sedimentisphaerales bacterium]|nr:hypothetical protein [Sedimentisphaerales bacterium]